MLISAPIEVNLDTFKRMGKELLTAIKDPTFTRDQIANGWHGFGCAYLGYDPTKELTPLDRVRGESEAHIVFNIISREYMEFTTGVAFPR